MLLGVVGLSLLLMAAVSFARPWDMHSGTGAMTVEQNQFFDETRGLRKEMHDKKFELRELTRKGADQAQINLLEADIDAIRAKIQAKAAEFGITGGPGSCYNQGNDCDTGQGCGNKRAGGCDGNGPCADNQQAKRGCGNKARCGQQ